MGALENLLKHLMQQICLLYNSKEKSKREFLITTFGLCIILGIIFWDKISIMNHTRYTIVLVSTLEVGVVYDVYFAVLRLKIVRTISFRY